MKENDWEEEFDELFDDVSFTIVTRTVGNSNGAILFQQRVKSFFTQQLQKRDAEIVGMVEGLKNPGPDVFMGTGGGRPFQDELDAWNAALQAIKSFIQKGKE